VIRLNQRRTSRVKHLLVSPHKPPTAADLRAAWVDLEPPLAVAGSGPAMAARVGPRRGAARRWRVHPSTGARVSERARGGAVTPTFLQE
jgi:hypothetical protein